MVTIQYSGVKLVSIRRFHWVKGERRPSKGKLNCLLYVLLPACTSCASFGSLNNIFPFKQKKYTLKRIRLTFEVTLF